MRHKFKSFQCYSCRTGPPRCVCVCVLVGRCELWVFCETPEVQALCLAHHPYTVHSTSPPNRCKSFRYKGGKKAKYTFYKFMGFKKYQVPIKESQRLVVSWKRSEEAPLIQAHTLSLYCIV